MKIFFMILLVILFVILSKNIAGFYIDRHVFFNSVKDMLNDFELNMSFRKDKLKQLVTNSKHKKRYFNDFIIQYENFVEKDIKPDLSNIKVLDEIEIELLKNMIYTIGKNDAISERLQIKSYICEIEEILAKTKIDKEKKVPLILKIGLLAGLLVAILFI